MLWLIIGGLVGLGEDSWLRRYAPKMNRWVRWLLGCIVTLLAAIVAAFVVPYTLSFLVAFWDGFWKAFKAAR